MTDLREKIARAINDWIDGCGGVMQSDYEIADVVMQVLREQELVGITAFNPLNAASNLRYPTPMPPSVPKELLGELRYCVIECINNDICQGWDRDMAIAHYRGLITEIDTLLAAAQKPEDSKP